ARGDALRDLPHLVLRDVAVAVLLRDRADLRFEELAEAVDRDALVFGVLLNEHVLSLGDRVTQAPAKMPRCSVDSSTRHRPPPLPWMAKRAPSTWRGPQLPRSCSTSSKIWPRTVAPIGWAFHFRATGGL